MTDPDIHALVGHGWIDQARTIHRLCCQACRKTFTVRKGTPLYYLKTDPRQVEMVLWYLAEELDQGGGSSVCRLQRGEHRPLVGSGWGLLSVLASAVSAFAAGLGALFLSDELRSYFYALTAHLGRWFRPPRPWRLA